MYVLSISSVARPDAGLYRTTILALAALSGLPGSVLGWSRCRGRCRGTAPPWVLATPTPQSCEGGGATPQYQLWWGGGAIRSLSGTGLAMTAGWWQWLVFYRVAHTAGREENVPGVGATSPVHRGKVAQVKTAISPQVSGFTQTHCT